jgi:hypothetical protein
MKLKRVVAGVSTDHEVLLRVSHTPARIDNDGVFLRALQPLNAARHVARLEELHFNAHSRCTRCNACLNISQRTAGAALYGISDCLQS